MGNKNRNIRVTPVPREEPDLRKLARAIIDLAIELNAAETTSVTALDSDSDTEDTTEQAA